MGAAQNRIRALAEAFHRRGHKITVLTALPNYPTGKIFYDYRGYYKYKEDINGIEVIRSWLNVHKSRSALSSALSFLSFALTAYNVGSREIKSADLLLWEYPPPFLGYTAMKLAKKWKACLVTNIADPWTHALEEQKILRSRYILNKISAFEERIMRESIAITGQTDGVLADIKARLPGSEPILWPNGADPDLFKPTTPPSQMKERFKVEGKFVVGYSGLHGRNHNLKLLLDAARILRTENDIVFMLCGDGFEKQKLVAYAEQNGLSNVQFHDPIPHNQLPEFLGLGRLVS